MEMISREPIQSLSVFSSHIWTGAFHSIFRDLFALTFIPSIHPSSHTIHPSTHPAIQSIHLPSHPFIHPSIHSSIHQGCVNPLDVMLRRNCVDTNKMVCCPYSANSLLPFITSLLVVVAVVIFNSEFFDHSKILTILLDSINRCCNFNNKVFNVKNKIYPNPSALVKQVIEHFNRLPPANWNQLQANRSRRSSSEASTAELHGLTGLTWWIGGRLID